MAAPSVCAAVLAGLCLQAPYDRAVDEHAFVVPALEAKASVVQRLGVRVEVYHGDDFRPHVADGLHRACVGGSCILYAKTCSDDRLHCEWDWGAEPARDRPDFYTWTFTISARSTEAMVRAERAISVQVDRQTVPLTELSTRSNLDYRPPCAGGEEATCVNPFYGRIPLLEVRIRRPASG